MVSESVSAHRLASPDFDLAHVADIEQADALAHGVVLFKDAGILHRHVPAAEIDHPGTELAVCGVECGSFERGGGLSHRKGS